ncbi:exopolysaccharide biosynthesis protein [Sulfuricaulis limicola]|uniref:Exopolysaccharide biosynthesis protein n=1 Tax=Sulfuricaulis limicola TaxID=1620215 RepID=A0A1B4XGI8_9GAMM|nr:CpsD/CapB family tyrosine-protein kinase [Sulfuricaulis limicola]BAV33926.1 exopolysaccharide biosynthesis protein [Sulfuricaulis limicola]
MERIKQALEKARLERQKVPGSDMSPTRGAVGMSAPLTYTHTRVIEVATEKLREKRIITDLDQNTFTDAYRILRTQVLQRLREKNWNSLAVTSPGENEGKTLTAINLAISMAMEINHTVLLVDADLRHPAMHKYFSVDAEYGLSDYLTGDKPLSELLVHPTNFPRFVILPGGKPLDNSAELLNSPKMVRLVEELKNRYPSRIVIFDLPPLLSAADALAFSPYVDSVLLVIEEGKTQADEARRALGLLDSTKVIGTVLNKSWTNMQDNEKASTKLLGWVLDHAKLVGLSLRDRLTRLRGKKN